MDNRILNTLIILVLAATVGGAGYYMTNVVQSTRIENLKTARQSTALQDLQVHELMDQQASTSAKAEEMWRRWRARYKVIPDEMETADIIEYLESLTRRGFRNFDMRLEGRSRNADIGTYTYTVTGRAFYSSLYDFIWHIENDRPFYRVRDLTLAHTEVFSENPETGVDRRHHMVSFTMKLDAYHAAADGVSAVEDESLMPIRREWLPVHNAPHNSFYPVVVNQLPPNDRLLPNIEDGTLVSIVADQAVFRDRNGYHYLKEGDSVYLGRVTMVDPFGARMMVTLNRGGVVQEIELNLTD